jgi:molecular chaperone GrpE
MKPHDAHRPHRDKAADPGAARPAGWRAEAAPHGGQPAGTPEPAATPPAEAAPGAAQPAPQDLLAAKTRECEALLDQLKRLAAEFSNYQKRMEHNLQERQRMAICGLVLDLLPVLDNFERALAHAQADAGAQALRTGVQAVYDQFAAALRKHGVTPFEAQGQAFDPEHHEAVTVVPSEEVPQGTVAEVMQTGYRLHGQLIRPSRVAVSGGPPKPDAENV